MMLHLKSPLMIFCLLTCSTYSVTAFSDTVSDSAEPEEVDPLDAMNTDPGDEEADTETDTEAEEEDQPGTPDEKDSYWVEKENEKYHFVGVRARLIKIPQFMFGLFGSDGGRGVLAPSIGPEYVTRRDGFEVDTWLTFTSFKMDDAPFKAKSDPDTAYEIVRSEIKTLTVGADFLWTQPLNDKGLSLVYGGGAGIGVVFGNLYRNQAYPPSGQPGNPEDYAKCPGPGQINPSYCDNENDHYGNYTEPSWFGGGAKPVLFPWIAIPQVGIRWKASRHLVLRLDTGLSLPGPFFFGLTGQYGLL